VGVVLVVAADQVNHAGRCTERLRHDRSTFSVLVESAETAAPIGHSAQDSRGARSQQHVRHPVPQTDVRACQPPLTDIVKQRRHQEVPVMPALTPEDAEYIEAVSLVARFHRLKKWP
jgi:hypothetical protein